MELRGLSLNLWCSDGQISLYAHSIIWMLLYPRQFSDSFLIICAPVKLWCHRIYLLFIPITGNKRLAFLWLLLHGIGLKTIWIYRSCSQTWCILNLSTNRPIMVLVQLELVVKQSSPSCRSHHETKTTPHDWSTAARHCEASNRMLSDGCGHGA